MKTLITVLAAFAIVSWRTSAAEGKVDFVKDIQPILDKSCIKCHGPEKQKGKLRLDSKEAAIKGGKGGSALVVNKSGESELFRRVSLPKDHDDFMPSEGDPLTKEQLELLKNWIDSGAVWPESAVKVTAAPKSSGPVLPADFKPGPNEAKAIAKLAEAGVDARPIAMNVPWREANFRLQGTNITDATLAPVKDLQSLVEINLATTKITDAGLENLKGLTNLTRLHLEQTQITDAGLAHLKGLKNLHYLNLYATKVTDAGLEHLKDLKNLKNLYVWQTKVTDEGVENFKKSLATAEVSKGWDTNVFAQIAAKIAEREKEREREKKEKAEKEKAEKEKADKEKADKEKAEKEKAAKAEKEKQEKAAKPEGEKKEAAEKKPEDAAKDSKKDDSKKEEPKKEEKKEGEKKEEKTAPK